MHSKVIIASLACILAATFGNTRTANVTKAQEIRAEKATCYNAPNEDGVTINFREDKIVYTEYQSYTVIFNLYYTDSICQGFQVINDPYNLFDSFFYFSNGQLGAYVNFPSSGITETYVSFGKNGKEMVRMYIHTNGSYSCASGASYYDARAKYYMWQVATSSEKSYYPQYWGNNFTLNSNASVNAIKHYGDYVYGTGTSDITTTRTTTSRSGWNDYGSNLSIKVHVEWYNNGQAYPVESARVKLFSKGSQITSGVCRTNANGDYTISMSAVNTFNKTLGDLQLGIFTDTAASIVRDNYGFEYPYFYVASSSTNLFNLKKIEYKVRIYPERSDRAAAYEIAQEELVVQKFVNYYSGTTISNNRTLYPAQRTTYLANDYDYGAYVVSLKKGHYHDWDVVQHEYAHYACDKLNLCCDPIEGFKHNYNEDLTIKYGQNNGLKYAYSEGLATYLAFAAQTDYSQRINPNSYCATIADCLYTDSLNNISINYADYKYGEYYSPHGAGVEASVASALLKLHYYHEGMNYQKMWSAILAAAGSTSDFDLFIEKLVYQNRGFMQEFFETLDAEQIAHPDDFLPRWTIMIYACGSTLEGTGGGNISTALSNIVSAAGTDDGVNIIIETGGSTGWGPIHNEAMESVTPDANMLSRFYVRNGRPFVEPNRPTSFERHASMGNEQTFEDFLRWGLEYYPAQKTGVILMNHGGAMKGVCFDEIYDFDSLTNAETKRALRNVLGENPTQKLEFISYEACLMCVQDIASFNSKYFHYMVATELEVDAAMTSGVNADWAGLLFDRTKSTLDVLKCMVDNYIQNLGATWEQCMTILNLDVMSAYHADFEMLASKIKDTIHNQRDLDSLISTCMISMPNCNNGGGLSDYRIADAFYVFQALRDWYQYDYISTYLEEMFKYFPAESEYTVIDWSAPTHVYTAESVDGLVVYHGAGANMPMTRGFSIHYTYYHPDFGYYSPEETDFNTWYSIFTTQYQ